MEQVTQAASQLGQPHSNEVVPHKISNHDLLVQASIWAGKDVGWLNLNDTQDQLNMKLDLHKVEKVVQSQVELLSGARSTANAAVSQAESAQKASNVNQAAIGVMDSAQKATQQEVDAAVKQISNHDKSLTEINSALTAAQSDIATQSTVVATVQTDLSAAKQQIKDANGNITAINQTAQSAYAIASDANSNAAEAKLTASDISTTVSGLSNQVDSLSDATKAVSDAMKSKADAGQVNQVVSQLTTSVNQTKDALTSKADKLDIDKLTKTVTDTNDTLTQRADQLSNTINQVSNTAGKNSTAISNLTQTVDGLQTTVKNKADQSMISQLSNQILEKVSSKDYQAEIALLTKDLNLRVSKDDLISQINLEAGGPGLIQVENGKGKLLLDADSVIFGHQAFIPSAAITDIQADKITSGVLDAGMIRVVNLTADSIRGGTLDVGNMHVKNFSANDIETGTLTGIDISAVDELGNLFDMKGSKLKWFSKGFEVDKDGKADDDGINGVITVSANNAYKFYQGEDTTPYRDTIHFGTDKDFWFSSGRGYDPDKDSYVGSIYSEFGLLGPSQSDESSPVGFYANAMENGMALLDGSNGITPPPSGFGFQVNTTNGAQFNLRPLNWQNGAHWEPGWSNEFAIQKNDHIGAYFGNGNDGNEINLTAVGGIKLNSPTIAKGGLQVAGGFAVISGNKSAAVETKQGYLCVSAYETAETYFGDIGENNTGSTSRVVIGIDRIFNEVVNTDIQYQVFITSYSDAHVWVKERYSNRFTVCSDKPNAEFTWELKAKRKGYESNRLRRIDVDFNKNDLKGDN